MRRYPRRDWANSATVRRLAIALAVAGGPLLILAAVWGSSQLRTSRVAPAADVVVQMRALSELQVFTRWLADNHVRGYIGEVGWPNNARGDAQRWNAVADAWYRQADAANLWVTAWDTHQKRCDYILAIYKTRVCGVPPLAIPDTQAATFESHPSTALYERGINVMGAAEHAPFQGEPTSSFSNRTAGQYGVDYVYDEASTFDFLASRGVHLVRLGFRWERVQPTPDGSFDPVELGRLHEAVQRAGRAGLHVILNPQNFAAYYLYDAQTRRGIRRTIGDADLPDASFLHLWTRLSAEFRDDSTVFGYGLMNEPQQMPARSGMTAAQTWEAESEEVLLAIRAAGDRKLVLVPGYNGSAAKRWTTTHPRAWITDPVDNYRYEAHQYFDSTGWGTYEASFDAEVADASARGFGRNPE